MTPKQREIMKHALGVGRGSPGWRNHFVTGPGSDDYADCEALVAAGLMTKRSGGPLSGGDPVYRVTDAGQDALVGRPKTPNAPHEGPGAASSRTVPLDAVVVRQKVSENE